MINESDFLRLVELLGNQALADIQWAEGINPPTSAREFAIEAIFVICNSGMKNTVARGIFERCVAALNAGRSASTAFGHKGKATAIDTIWTCRWELFGGYLASRDKLAFLEGLPWIGGITKYHLAKNFGLQVAKPDVHLQRLADREGCTAQALCEQLAEATGFKVATVDTVLWRACATGVLNSRTGVISPPKTPQPSLLESQRCAGCDIPNGCPEYCRCTPGAKGGA